MSTTTLPPPETFADLHTQDALHFRDILVEFIDLGAVLIRGIVQQAQAHNAPPAPDAAPPSLSPQDCNAAYASVTRSVRRSMLLAQKLTDPNAARAAEMSAGRRTAARKQIIRAVEDAIHQDALAAEAGDLQAELLERIETPEFDEELDQRPAPDIINDMRADFGILGPHSQDVWKRRTPEDIAILNERAAAPCRAKTGPFVAPMPPPGWTGRFRPAPADAPDAAPPRYTAGLPDA
jgi:hypothetical protein